MRLVKSDKRQTWTPSMWVTPNYGTLWGYYGYCMDLRLRGRRGTTRVDTVVVIENLIFSVPLNKLLWAGVTETHQPEECRGGHQGHRGGKRQGDDQGRPDPPK